MKRVHTADWQTLRQQLPLIGWLVLVWVALWGTWTLANVISGTLVALTITWLLPLPPVHLEGRVEPLPLLRFVSRFCWDVVQSSLQVAWLSVRPGPPPRSAVMAVQLRTRSELLLVLTGEALSLVPGSLIVEIDRERSILYLHVIDVADLEAVQGHRDFVLDLERRLVRAIGDPESREAVRAADAASSPGTDRGVPA